MFTTFICGFFCSLDVRRNRLNSSTVSLVLSAHRPCNLNPRCCVFCNPGALTFGYGCTGHVGVDVGAGDAEVDIIYITFIMSAQYIAYLILYKDKVQVDNWTTCTTEISCTVLDRII